MYEITKEFKELQFKQILRVEFLNEQKAFVELIFADP